jgi:hypothetical protein
MVQCPTDGSWCCGSMLPASCCLQGLRITLQATVGAHATSSSTLTFPIPSSIPIGASSSVGLPLSPTSQLPSQPPDTQSNSISTGIGIGVGVGVGAAALASAAIFFVLRRRRRRRAHIAEQTAAQHANSQEAISWNTQHEMPAHNSGKGIQEMPVDSRPAELLAYQVGR